MPKSIVQIQVDDDQFQKFKSSYDQYVESLKKLPGAWSKQNAAVEQTGISFVELAAALFAQSELTHKVKDDHEKIEKSSDKIEKSTKKTSGYWKDIKRDTKDVLGNITGAAEQLLKWTGLTTIAAGLLGAGGGFGAFKLAENTAGFRRQGFGINATIGEQRAFKIDYQRFLANPEGLLSGISDVGNDLTKQGSMFGQQVGSLTRAGMDSAQIAAKLLPQMVDKFIAMGGLRGQGANIEPALGYGALGLTTQDMLSLARQRQSLGQAGSDFQRDAGDLGISQDTADKMQNFVNQLDRAGGKIETVFVDDLAYLEPGLEKLSGAAVDLVDAFAKSDKVKYWLGELSDGMERLAGWLNPGGKNADGTPASGGSAPSDYVPPSRDNHPDYTKGDWWDRNVNAHLWGPGAKGAGNSADVNNVLGLTSKGGGFQSFPSMDASIAGAYHQIELDINKHGAKTLGDLIGDPTWGWASAKNGDDIPGYLRRIKGDTGFDPNTKLDGNNLQQIAEIMAAMSKVEQPKHAYTPEMVLKVLNQTGGSAVISANQVAQ